MVKAPPIKDMTSLYCPANSHQCLIMASHWVCPVTGKYIKIPAGLKLVYIHRYNKHKYFSDHNKQYCESHKRVADSLGISLESVKGTYTKLLKRMGLMKSENVNTNKLHYTIFDIKDCEGWLVNPTLKTYTKDKLQDLQQNNTRDKFTYDNLKNIEHNKKQARLIKSKSECKFFAVDELQMAEFRKAYKYYTQQKEKQLND